MAKMLALLVLLAFLAAVLIVYSGEITGLFIRTGQSDIEKARAILEGYNISQPEGFYSEALSCLSMHEMLTNSGFDASIMLGNTGTWDLAHPEDVWVMLSGAADSMAIDSSGRMVVLEENPMYYNGYSFSDTERFSEYLQLRQSYEEAVKRAEMMESEFNKCSSDMEEMAAVFNSKYGGKILTEESSDQKALVYEKKGECTAILDMLNNEKNEMSYMEKSMSNILSSAETF